MKNLKFITSSLLAVFAIVLGSAFFTSSTTVEKSNSKAISELSAELADMKEELANLKENEVVSSDPFLGEVILFAGNFAPRGWAFCEGQLLSIAQNTALFSLLGTIYGGDGVTTFSLPDLRGRTPIGAGSGPGLSTFREGDKGGTENVTLLVNNLPSHDHSLVAGVSVPGIEKNVMRDEEFKYEKGAQAFVTVGNSPSAKVSAGVGERTSPTGGNLPVSIRNPYLGMHYIIALQGTFPSRS